MTVSTSGQNDGISTTCIDVEGLRADAAHNRQLEKPSAPLDASKKIHVLSADDIRSHHDRLARRRRMLYGDLIRRTLCVTLSKVFLYVWDVVVIFAGLCILCYGLYLRFFEVDGAVSPPISVYIVALAALGLVFVSIASLVGLQRQRKCVTDGRRNYVLAIVSIAMYDFLLLLLPLP